MVIERQIDDLNKAMWTFTLHQLPLIILDSYVLMNRETKRKSWKIKSRQYNRLMDRDSIIKNGNDVPIPEDVKEEAISTLREQIEVLTWEQFKAK